GQREGCALGRIPHAHSPAGGLRSAKVNAGVGESVPTVAVEDQVAGLEMDGILEFLRGGLVRCSHAARIRFQINLHFASRDNVARFRIESEVITINLIKPRGVTAIENDADVMQFGTAVELEFLNVLGLDGKNGAAGFGL